MAHGHLAGYTVREVAQIVGVPVARVRAYVKDGVLSPRPGREHRFTMQDLLLLRTAKGLETLLGPIRVRRALRALRERVGDSASLTALQLAVEGDSVLVRENGRRWEAESGQSCLDFDDAPVRSAVSLLSPRTARAETAAAWYERGLLDLEHEPAAAEDALRTALALDAGHVPAQVELGRLLHEQGRAQEALGHYRAALALDPGHATAAFNLGVALEDLGRFADATAAYEQALASDASLADAHYNLWRLSEKKGARVDAFRHLNAYRRLTRVR